MLRVCDYQEHSMGKLHPELQTILQTIREKRAFKADEWTNAKCKMLNDYLTKCKLSGLVINMSGGIDSSVTAALCLHAQKMEGSPIKRVVGVAQPIHVSFLSR